jgi:hypothetical protein
MKRFQVACTDSHVYYIMADRAEWDEKYLTFYLGDAVIRVFPRPEVLQLDEFDLGMPNSGPPQPGPYSRPFSDV